MSKRNTLLNMLKKPAIKQSQDWHAADVVAAVRKTGTSLQRLSRLNGLSDSVLGQALYKPYPKCERIIAEYLGVAPQSIWPSRYNLDGSTKSGRGERGLGRHASRLKANANDTPHKQSRNVYALDSEAA
jgi:Ner family transcriptional regulator